MDNLKIMIARIEYMEQLFDEVSEAVNSFDVIEENPCLKEKIEQLNAYYSNGWWLHDYECDERGELPADLKRGVLSQDGLYDLFCMLGNY